MSIGKSDPIADTFASPALSIRIVPAIPRPYDLNHKKMDLIAIE